MHRGERMSWSELPASTSAAIDELCGAAVVRAVDQAGGFSPGVAARCVLDDGRRVFVKAVSAAQNPVSPGLYRQEIDAHRHLPADAPIARLLASQDDGDWVVLVFDDVEGSNPRLPWSMQDLEAVLDALAAIEASVDPESLLELPSLVDLLVDEFTFWRRVVEGDPLGDLLDPTVRRRADQLAALEAGWAEAAQGDRLLHSDLRADNLILSPDGKVVIVDWPGASRGAAWVDRLLMLPSVGLDGGPRPEEVITALDPFRGVGHDHVDAVLSAVAGYFVVGGLQDPPPGLPTVRAFQRAQGEIALAWLGRRLGWDR